MITINNITHWDNCNTTKTYNIMILSSYDKGILVGGLPLFWDTPPTLAQGHLDPSDHSCGPTPRKKYAVCAGACTTNTTTNNKNQPTNFQISLQPLLNDTKTSHDIIKKPWTPAWPDKRGLRHLQFGRRGTRERPGPLGRSWDMGNLWDIYGISSSSLWG